MQFRKILLLCLVISLVSCRFGKIMSKADPETETTVDTLTGPRELTTKGAELGEFEVSMEEDLIDFSQFKKTKRDLEYIDNKDSQQTLDIIYSPEGEKPYKPIVVFYGGGLTGKDLESENLTSIFEATEHGYAIVPVKYRSSEEWPASLHNAKAAIRFLRANSRKLNLDTDEIVALGASAGGHMAQMLAATNEQRDFEDLSMGNPDTSSAVQGVVSWDGVSNLYELPEAATAWANEIAGFDVEQNREKTKNLNPVDLVTASIPPILLVHGINDQFVPFQQAEEMQQRVNRATQKRTARLVPYENEKDGDPASKRNKRLQETLDFVDKILYDGNNPFRK